MRNVTKRRILESGKTIFKTIKDRDMEDAAEKINHPSHYGGNTFYETIKVIEAWDLDFHLGNAVKYISRAGKKTNDSIEDLKKAVWYLERKIKILSPPERRTRDSDDRTHF